MRQTRLNTHFQHWIFHQPLKSGLKLLESAKPLYQDESVPRRYACTQKVDQKLADHIVVPKKLDLKPSGSMYVRSLHIADRCRLQKTRETGELRVSRLQKSKCHWTRRCNLLEVGRSLEGFLSATIRLILSHVHTAKS